MQTSTYPGYQRFLLACDEELRRPQADKSSAFGRNWKPHMERESIYKSEKLKKTVS